ncbi:hypothetical protein [Streptomyces sp. S.PB5]|uniref:hypothetical protein n=1 Tax=Streptomyces sp. S.PB5 TaxID=3020844 RepID=UPI0025AFE8C9|nr:hypothetical protein [Streptomyces sp. S.PB5]MDN3026188.1 hypothetical protein [Streptomyces sp. S.PB5]
MPQNTFPSTELTSQYTAQVASDLERNAKEQQRIEAEIAALQEQLLALQHDHSVLVNMQKALSATDAPTEAAPAAPSPEDAAVPSPRHETPAKPATGKRSRTKKAGTEQDSKSPKKTAAKSATKTATKTAAAKTAKPTLVELIRGHLTEQTEPRSAAEVATALGQTHPERNIKTTVVRTTLEGLVAKSQAQRAKQGSSVFYTAADTPAPPKTATDEAQTDQSTPQR